MRPDDPREIPIDDDRSSPSGSRGEKPAGSAEGEGSEDDVAVATEPIGEEVEEEIERLRDRLLRLQAEFDNFRKREARERAAAWARAKADLVQKLLGSLDDLERVASLDPSTATSESIIDGARLLEKKLKGALQREGLVEVGVVGEPFDPHIHEAISAVPAPSPDHEGRVAAVAAPGFRFGSQLLRPAQVQVFEAGH
jgi:molecular chaperone GrpE